MAAGSWRKRRAPIAWFTISQTALGVALPACRSRSDGDHDQTRTNPLGASHCRPRVNPNQSPSSARRARASACDSSGTACSSAATNASNRALAFILTRAAEYSVVVSVASYVTVTSSQRRPPAGVDVERMLAAGTRGVVAW